MTRVVYEQDAARAKRPARQSSSACTMRSRRLETKFHHMRRGGPSSGSPPTMTSRASASPAWIDKSPPLGSTTASVRGASAAPFENAPELISVSASGENDWLNEPYSVSQSSGS